MNLYRLNNSLFDLRAITFVYVYEDRLIINLSNGSSINEKFENAAEASKELHRIEAAARGLARNDKQTNMIKLTTVHGSLYVKVDIIVAIFVSNVTGTIILCDKQRSFEVKESPEDINKLIEDYYMKC